MKAQRVAPPAQELRLRLLQMRRHVVSSGHYQRIHLGVDVVI